MIQKTKNYEMFKFRDDNRDKISHNHINKLKKSIEAVNLLSLRPITVNSNMEIIDGQHRLKAAQALGLEIFYEVKEDLQIKDLIHLNVQRSWKYVDYLNFYVKQGYPEYIKFKEYIDENNLSITSAVKLGAVGFTGKNETAAFREGKLTFKGELLNKKSNLYHEICNVIKRLKVGSKFQYAVRFFEACIRLISHENYNHEKFMSNLTRLIDRVEPKATFEMNLKMLCEVNNWKNNNPIEFK